MGAGDGPHPEDGEGPQRPVDLDAYQISATAVSNADFGAFVDATGHRTHAERSGASHVFAGHLDNPDRFRVALADAPWWRVVPGANWRVPFGTGAAIPDHPVVHVSFIDAVAYCAWSGTRLPTEAEWECAVRAGAGQADRNIWRGSFPDAPDGIPGPVPVAMGQPNANGIFHGCGNVWEWVSDGFSRLHSPRIARNPSGNLAAVNRVVKGGSYLCCPSYCSRFRPSSRRDEAPDATTGHMGFRIAR